MFISLCIIILGFGFHNRFCIANESMFPTNPMEEIAPSWGSLPNSFSFSDHSAITAQCYQVYDCLSFSSFFLCGGNMTLSN